MSSLGGPSSKAVLTFLTPAERSRVDAAGQGCYTTMHREDLEQVLVDLRSRPVSAIIVSVARYQQQHASHMARLVREFPRVPAVALLTANEARTTQALLSLGHQGVRTLVDARDPAGWRDLRQFVAREIPGSIESIAMQRMRRELEPMRPACLAFFDALFTVPTTLTTVRELARLLGVMPTTFMSRFFRHGLPAPKKYLALARLVRAAALMENPGYSITQVALLLEYSSPQSFSRHVQGMLDCGAATFRRRYSGESMLQEMCERVVIPYRDALRTFDPIDAPPSWLTRQQESSVDTKVPLPQAG
ncbi:MAG TPA: helix-turn-helix domain-containing protein [Gemmatimonas sp.]|uniref:helix-turn-helix domain-containing protein n=1 Tax=Gemmatimonas sp. TaxID=1962908 RepID=UPI002ED9DB3A